MEAEKAEKEAKRAAKLAKRETIGTAEITPPLAARVDGLPIAVALPMPTPVAMPNLGRAAAALGVTLDAD